MGSQTFNLPTQVFHTKPFSSSWVVTRA